MQIIYFKNINNKKASILSRGFFSFHRLRFRITIWDLVSLFGIWYHHLGFGITI